MNNIRRALHVLLGGHAPAHNTNWRMGDLSSVEGSQRIGDDQIRGNMTPIAVPAGATHVQVAPIINEWGDCVGVKARFYNLLDPCA